MKKSALIALIAVAAGPAVLRADIWGVNYSGRLLKVADNTASVPANTGVPTTMTVRIYDESDSAGTNVIWQRSYDTYVMDGWFTLELDGLADALPEASGDRLTIGVTPEGGTEIAPRQKFASVPTAVCAFDALGANCGISITGQLSAATLQAAGASFHCPVAHAGQTVFKEQFGLPELRLTNSAAAFSAGELAVSSPATVENLATASLSSDGEVTLEVASVGALSAATLAATNSSVLVRNLLQGAGGAGQPGDLTVDGNLTTANGAVCRADSLRVGPSHSFFRWKDKAFRLRPGSTSEDTVYGYLGDGSTGAWKVQYDCFLSISPKIKAGGSVTITVKPMTGDTVEYTQSASGGDVALPLQMFVNKGDVVSWTGAEREDTKDNFRPYLTYREFTY